MRIKSKFKDYYDCGQFLGQDPNLVYVRMPAQGSFTKLLPINLIYGIRGEIQNPRQISYHSSVVPILGWIWFCGKIYPYIQIKAYKRKVSEIENNVEYFYVQNEKHLRDFLIEFYGSEERYKKERIYKETYWRVSKLEKMFLFLQQTIKLPEIDKIAVEEHCPIFEIKIRNTTANFEHSSGEDSKRFTVEYEKNPNLSLVGFYKVEDAYTAFSEIEMFLGGVLARKENETVDISDKHMAEAKGFDCYSFKKEPTKRKRKKCQHK